MFTIAPNWKTSQNLFFILSILELSCSRYLEQFFHISTQNVALARVRNNTGNHGYDNNLQTMKPIFIARGPAFKAGKNVGPIESVDIYPLVCYLLDIQPAPNNGSLDRAATLLKNYRNSVSEFSSYRQLMWFLIAALILTVIWLLECFCLDVSLYE